MRMAGSLRDRLRPLKRLSLALALALAGCAPAVTGLAPAPPAARATDPAVAAPRPPPPAPSDAPNCAIDDRLTPERAYDDPAATILDRTYALPADYLPPDLEPLGGEVWVRRVAVPDLEAMRDAAARSGTAFRVVSGFRPYAEQELTFQHWVAIDGLAAALQTSARPGHSEHQLGTAIDVAEDDTPPWQDGYDFAHTRAGTWLATHAWEYGFVMSYPFAKEAVTCYAYEPWHFRWIGRANAATVRASGLTLREFQEARRAADR